MAKQNKIVSVVAQKGGCSKTTLAVNIAVQMKKNYPALRVALIDADPQRSASEWLSVSDEKSGVHVFQMEGSLESMLGRLESDVTIVDCPPGIHDVTVHAIVYSDLTLIPVGHSSLELKALTGILEACKKVTAADPTKKYLLVPSRVTAQSTSGKEFRDTLKAYGVVSRSQLAYRVAYSDGVLYGTGVCYSHPGSAAHKEISELTREVQNILKLREPK